MSAPGRMRLFALGCGAATPALALCLFDPVHFTRFGPPKLALAWLGVGLGLALVLGDNARREVPVPWREHLPWLLFLGWGGLSLQWSPAPGRGLVQLATWALGWAVLTQMGQALVARSGATVQRGRRVVILAWLAAGVVCSLVALYQRLWGWRVGVHQVTGTLGNPNLVAISLLALLPLGHSLARTEDALWLRIVGWMSAPILVAGVWATRCRAAWIAMAAMGLYWLATTRWSPRRRLVAVVGLGALAAVGGWIWQSVLQEELTGRLWLARISLGVIRDAPWVGTGLGGYANGAAWSQAALLGRQTGPWSNLHDAHNQLLMVLAELGPVGVLGLALVVFPPLVRCFRSRADPVARDAMAAWIGLGVMGLSESVLLSPVVVLIAFGWLALGQTGDGKDRPHPYFVGLGAAVVLVGGLWVASGQLLANYYLGRGLAAASQPGSQSGSAAHLRRAVVDYSTGLSYGGDPSELLLHRAIAWRELGRLDRAGRDMEASYRLLPSPERALFLGDLAVSRRAYGDAIWWYQRAIQIHPRYARGYNNLGVAHLRAGQVSQACRYLRRALSLRPFGRSIRTNWKKYCGTD